MNQTRFQKLLDAHGPDLSRWPARERDAADALLARSADARVLMRQAAALDALLGDALAGEAAPDSLRDAVLRIPVERPRGAQGRAGGLFAPFRLAWGAGFAALAASAAVGFINGAGYLATNDVLPVADISGLIYGTALLNGGLL